MNCIGCPKTLYVRGLRQAQTRMCRACRRMCNCGKTKDDRAIECQSCSSKKKIRAQWDNECAANKMRQGLAFAGRKRRVRYGDLTEEFFRNRKLDGRIWGRYWGEDEKVHTIYRYQWRWAQVHGPIPDGFVIHHKDNNHTNDSLENLELLTFAEHTRLHAKERAKRKAA